MIPNSEGWWWRIQGHRLIPVKVLETPETILLTEDGFPVYDDGGWYGKCLTPVEVKNLVQECKTLKDTCNVLLVEIKKAIDKLQGV